MVGSDGGGGDEADPRALEQGGVAAVACPDDEGVGVADGVGGDFALIILAMNASLRLARRLALFFRSLLSLFLLSLFLYVVFSAGPKYTY